MGLKELTIPKFIIFGNGQIRNGVGIPEDDEDIEINTESCERR